MPQSEPVLQISSCSLIWDVWLPLLEMTTLQHDEHITHRQAPYEPPPLQGLETKIEKKRPQLSRQDKDLCAPCYVPWLCLIKVIRANLCKKWAADGCSGMGQRGMHVAHDAGHDVGMHGKEAQRSLVTPCLKRSGPAGLGLLVVCARRDEITVDNGCQVRMSWIHKTGAT